MIAIDSLLHDLQKVRHLRHWLPNIPAAIESGLSILRYGNLPQWMQNLERLPRLSASCLQLNDNTIAIGNHQDCSNEMRQQLEAELRQLQPWRKGPYNLFGVDIQTEWRSDRKWQRVVPHISPLKGRAILDVGCGNGYHCWRMIGEGARLVLGIDPNPLFLAQFQAIKRYTNNIPVHILPLKSEDLPTELHAFDTVFSMGVLYHRRSPFDHIMELKSFLRPGGQLILESLVVPGEENHVLVPHNRYAQMRNVWFLPTPPELKKWLVRCGFENVEVVDVNQTTIHEQRSTSWMTYQSLSDFLEPSDFNKTIEGYPAPTRATLVAQKPK